MNIKNLIIVFFLCTALSACSSTAHTDSDICIEEANSTDNNGAQTSTEVYNQCISEKIEEKEKNNTIGVSIGTFFFELFADIATN